MSDTNENWLTREFARARDRSAQLPSWARPVLVRTAAAREILEEGDTGEAILPVPVSAIAARLNASRVEVDGSTLVEAEKVSDKGVHADRDGSEAPFVYCGRGACAAPEGHAGTCAEASGWDDEAPRGDNPSTSLPAARDAESSVLRMRFELMRAQRDNANSRTLRMWERAKAAEARLARVEALLRDEKRHLHRWIDDSCLVDVEDVLEALS